MLVLLSVFITAFVSKRGYHPVLQKFLAHRCQYIPYRILFCILNSFMGGCTCMCVDEQVPGTLWRSEDHPFWDGGTENLCVTLAVPELCVDPRASAGIASVPFHAQLWNHL